MLATQWHRTVGLCVAAFLQESNVHANVRLPLRTYPIIRKMDILLFFCPTVYMPLRSGSETDSSLRPRQRASLTRGLNRGKQWLLASQAQAHLPCYINKVKIDRERERERKAHVKDVRVAGPIILLLHFISALCLVSQSRALAHSRNMQLFIECLSGPATMIDGTRAETPIIAIHAGGTYRYRSL